MRVTITLAAILLMAGSAAAQPGPQFPPGAQPGPQPPAEQQAPAEQQQAPDGQQAAPDQQAQPFQPAPGRHMNLRQRFEAANTSRDGRLTREQAQAAGMHMVVARFNQIDVDRKGYVTLQDIAAFRQARHQQQQAQQPSQGN